MDHLASDPFFRNYRHLNEKLVEVIEDYSLVSFVPLNVQVMWQEEWGRENRECWIWICLMAPSCIREGLDWILGKISLLKEL